MTNIPKIILASKSARRKEILEHLGLSPTIIVSGADENVEESLSPERFVEEISLRKASAVLPLCKGDELIVASDTVVFCNGKILGKPHGYDEAKEMLSLLSGCTHRVISGLALIYNGKTVLSHEVTEVLFRSLSDDEIDKYISADSPYDKAGAYGIQDTASVFVEKINGDYFNVVGLPVFRMFSEIKKHFGLDFFDFLKK